MSQMSQIEALARAVADDLQAVSSEWPESFLVTYEPQPDVNLTDLNRTRVFVRDETERMVQPFASRSKSEYEYDIAVSVWRKISGTKTATVSKLKYVGEQIADTFRFLGDREYWPTGRSERLKRVDLIQIWEDAAAEQQGIIKLRVLLVFQAWRD